MSCQKITVSTASASSTGYAVLIEDSSYPWEYLSKLHEKFRKEKKQVALITDSNMKRCYKAALDELRDEGWPILAIAAGEGHKNAATKEKIETFLFKNKITRSSTVVALGGGVVGDLVGFVAATFMRGISWQSLPSSIVAMVDASIGGKTGIDTPFGKNLVGSFHNPKEVYISLALLSTLREKEYRNGFAEVAKHALIADRALYQFLKKNIENIQRRDMKTLQAIVRKNVLIKKNVVTEDERESGLRRILNFGHTVGHGLEWLSAFKLSHGEAVSIGMAAEAYFSYKLGLLSHADFQRIVELLSCLGLRASMPAWSHGKIPEPYKACLLDKKASASVFCFSAIQSIGRMHAAGGEYLLHLERRQFLLLMRDFCGQLPFAKT